MSQNGSTQGLIDPKRIVIQVPFKFRGWRLLVESGKKMTKQRVGANMNARGAKDTEHSSSSAELERQDATLGGRLRMIRRGVMNATVEAFAKATGRSTATVKRYEANTGGAPGDDFLARVSELSGVPLGWIKDRQGAFLGTADPLIQARIQRGAARESATGSGNVARYPTALEQAMEQMPPSAAMRGERVSLELLTDVVKTVEAWLHENRNKVRLSPDKKAMLIAIAYAHFEGRTFQKQEMEQFFRLVA